MCHDLGLGIELALPCVEAGSQIGRADHASEQVGLSLPGDDRANGSHPPLLHSSSSLDVHEFLGSLIELLLLAFLLLGVSCQAVKNTLLYICC